MLRVAPRYQGLAILHEQYLKYCDYILEGIAISAEKVAAINEMQRILGCTDAELGDRKRSLKENDNVDLLLCAPGGCDVADGGEGRGAGDSSTTEPEPAGPTQQSPLRPRSRRRQKL